MVVVLGGGGCVVVFVLAFFNVVFTDVDSVLFGGESVVDVVCTVDFIVVDDDGALLVVFRVVVGGFFAAKRRLQKLRELFSFSGHGKNIIWRFIN